ncbi:MAG: HlyC/CorC family transporter [Alphaproteobacteria bacterium]|nr:HlyC/CorC family transporter [Alphaproteobacteria bacterium]MBV9693668.1 HlyC/CorC family transporter [Alphaproteobacteria bacterium]
MRESLEGVLEESDLDRTLSDQERRMLANLLKVGELRVEDVMVPRADIVAVEESTALAELVALFGEAQHSRLPVYRETLDDPTGLVHIKDVLALIAPQDDGSFRWSAESIAKIKRPLLFVPPSMPVLDLLLKMQTTHMQLALVIDEYGGTDGLVSIEDLIEEIVGDIADEHDEEAPQVRGDGSGAYIADARIDLEDFRSATGLALGLDDEEAQDIDTLGGLVIYLLGRVPQRGEIVAHPNSYEFEVLEADPRRVKRLRIRGPFEQQRPTE